MTKAFEEAIRLIRRFEGCRLKAYKCPAGKWTIGWGETKGVRQGMTWTQDYADAMLESRVMEFMGDVKRACPALGRFPKRWAACTSLAYNIGIEAFSRSSVRRNTNNEAWTAAANSFLLWNKSNGKVMAGLVRRRSAEKRLYESEGL